MAKDKLSKGGIAGVVVGTLVIFLIVAAFIGHAIWLGFRKKRNPTRADLEAAASRKIPAAQRSEVAPAQETTEARGYSGGVRSEIR